MIFYRNQCHCGKLLIIDEYFGNIQCPNFGHYQGRVSSQNSMMLSFELMHINGTTLIINYKSKTIQYDDIKFYLTKNLMKNKIADLNKIVMLAKLYGNIK